MLKTVGLSLLLTISTAALAELRYDQANDLLSVEAHGQPLSQVLAEMADATGAEILMDPSVDRPVDLSITERPLRAGLEQMTRGMNRVLIESDEPGAGFTLKLLPPGEADSAALRRLGVATATKPADDRLHQRLTKLDQLPPAQRDAAQEKLIERELKKQRHNDERAAKQAERAADRAKRQAKADAARQQQLAELQHTDPERYAQLMEQQAARQARQQVEKAGPRSAE